jgi:hypothetical protein
MPKTFDGQDGEWFSADEVTAAKNKAAQAARSEAEREAKAATAAHESQVTDLTKQSTAAEAALTALRSEFEEKIALLEQAKGTAETAAAKAARESLLLTEFIARDVPVPAARRLTALVPADADISTPAALEAVLGPLQADLPALFVKTSPAAAPPEQKPPVVPQIPPNGSGGSPAPTQGIVVTAEALASMTPAEQASIPWAERHRALMAGSAG